MQGDKGEGGGRNAARYATWLGLAGAVLIILATAFAMNQRRQAELSKPEALTSPPASLIVVGAALNGENLDPVAARFHNFLVACAAGELKKAEAYIDPESFLTGQAAAACGPVVTPLAPAGVTRVVFERLATDRYVSSVYITAQQPQSAKESYIFVMRKVKGKWYFSPP